MTVELDSTGDTWSAVPYIIESSPTAAVRYDTGDWAVKLWLSAPAPASTSVRVVLTRHSAGCVLQDTIIDATKVISGASFSLYSWLVSGVAPITFLADDILLLVLYETEGAAILQYDQSGSRFSFVQVPSIVTVRPHEYYKRQRRRRAC